MSDPRPHKSPPRWRHTLPVGLPFWHPAALVATWFGTGLLPKMSGTWGALGALPVAWVLARDFGPYAVAGAGAFLFLVGIWASGVYVHHSRETDPRTIVIDEVAAMMFAAAPAGLDPVTFGLAFVMFRVFDIIKPWPVGLIDRYVRGAFGVMADDIAAAVYAILVELAYIFIARGHHVFF